MASSQPGQVAGAGEPLVAGRIAASLEALAAGTVDLAGKRLSGDLITG